MDEIQLAVSPSLIKVHKFYGQEEEVAKYKKTLNKLKIQLANPLLDDEEIQSVKKEQKSLKHPAEIEATAFKEACKSTGDVGHLEDYYYVTENNPAIDAFEFGIKKATEEFKLNVDLGIAWNTGRNWLIIFWPRIIGI